MACTDLQTEIYTLIAKYVCKWQKNASLGKCTKCIEKTLTGLVLAAQMYDFVGEDDIQKLRTLVLNAKDC